MTPKKIVLNMIVKNESKVIQRLLSSVRPLIDFYCICDTGSTDNTKDIIREFFKGYPHIRGKIVDEPFQNFEYNRNFALEQCLDVPADYILLIDADMVLNINIRDIQVWKNSLKDDMYMVFQGNPGCNYKNTRFMRNGIKARYWGVTHEYISYPTECGYTQAAIDISQLFIVDIGDGGAKTGKYERDIQLLERGLETHPNNDRYLFYLANSYRDAGQLPKAIDTYLQRIGAGGWFEEIWHSHYSLGKCYKALGQYQSAIYHWLQAYQVYPARIENLYQLIHYYRNSENYHLAMAFYRMADEVRRKYQKEPDFLFYEKDVVDWKLDYEAIFSFYYSPDPTFPIHRICIKTLCYQFLTDDIFNNVLSNYKFYAPVLKPLLTDHQFDDRLALLQPDIEKHGFLREQFCTSTPTFCFDSADRLTLIVRCVNYRVLDDGSYQCHPHIETKNILMQFDIHDPLNWVKTNESVIKYDRTLDDKYVGLEDMRLYYDSRHHNIMYSANRGIGDGSKIMVEVGALEIKKKQVQTVSSVCLQLENGKQGAIEKNWVLFEDSAGLCKVIHSWFPLTIGVMIDKLFVQVCSIPTPTMFKRLRGSSNGIHIGNELWFICHTVSEEARRYYYHIFIVLDANSYRPIKCSPYFTFEGKPVEYCLGFTSYGDHWFIGYSILDRETKYMMMPKEITHRSMINFI
jgi:tetratricopeptide (TPR) repeat protein